MWDLQNKGMREKKNKMGWEGVSENEGQGKQALKPAIGAET